MQCIEHYSLGNHQICESGKFALLDDLLPRMRDNDDRVLIFTQFTMVLDIMEQYLRIRGHKYLRLDGSTPVQERYGFFVYITNISFSQLYRFVRIFLRSQLIMF